MEAEKKDLSRCECGSDQFLVDITDTIVVRLDSEGKIREYGKRYDGDLFNMNCEGCGEPAERQPDAKQKEAT